MYEYDIMHLFFLVLFFSFFVLFIIRVPSLLFFFADTFHEVKKKRDRRKEVLIPLFKEINIFRFGFESLDMSYDLMFILFQVQGARGGRGNYYSNSTSFGTFLIFNYKNSRMWIFLKF